MKPDRWQQINELFHEALSREPEERAAFLGRACLGDDTLRHEVESLLASDERAESFIEAPAFKVMAELITDGQSELLIGRTVGPYQVLSLLGAGGMGEVYLAEDARLGRKVALKVLPTYFTRDEERVRRFQQEARAASALNHPNILTIYEVGQIDSRHLMATEYIEGETLRLRLGKGQMKIGEALDVAAQVAAALSAAHQAGIMHRDIKPENIIVRQDGIVKVLDFGLAKLTEPEVAAVDTTAPTRPQINTEPGVVMGTVAYMSPEQARGQAVDARTDIWSLGVALYEMVAGCLPFLGSSNSEVLAAILSDKEPPPLARYAREAPAELERIVRKALHKGREERYQTVKDMLLDLKSLKQELEFEAKLERGSRRGLTAMGAPERSTPPESKEKAVARSGQLEAETMTEPAARPTLSAEMLGSAIRRHKTGAVIAPVAIVIAVATAAYLYSGRSGRAAINSMAVLPFVNDSADPNIEYLSDGITESLINSLSQVPHLRMIARSSVFRYKGRETDPQAVGRELGVQAILMGRVVQRGDNLSISAELVDARDNSRIWGERYKRTVGDVIATQEDISLEISKKLQPQLSGEQQQPVTRRYTRNTEAYQLYLQGRYYLNKDSLQEIKKAIKYFDQAIAMDPDYALAYTGLADTYIELGQPWVGGLPPAEALREARAAATKALGIDDTLGEAHSSVAHVIELYDWDWSGAEREYKRAIELNPNDATAHMWYSEYLQVLGRDDEAIAEEKRAIEVDPLNNFVKGNLGYSFYTARRYDQAIEQFQKVGDHGGLGWVYTEKKMREEAITELQTAMSLTGRRDVDVASLGYIYGVSGKKGEARKLLDELMGRSDERYVSPYLIAYIYTGLGERDQAFEWLGKGYESHDQWMIWLKVDPKLDSLRSDQRFTDLVRRIGLPQ